MARIDLDQSATPTWQTRPAYETTRCAKCITPWDDGGPMPWLGPLGLRQDHVAQHQLSGAALGPKAKILFDAKDVTGLQPKRRNIRPQVFPSSPWSTTQ